METASEIKLYIDRARLALQQSKDNLDLGHYDVAVSRAYYAMFYAATALLHSQGISRKKHSGVHSAFGQQFVKTGLIEPGIVACWVTRSVYGLIVIMML